MKMVKEFIELPYLLDVIEVDKKRIHNSDMMIKNIMIRHLSGLQEQANRTIYDLKQTLKKRNIKIIEQNKLDDRLEITYSCRGYQHSMTLLWSKVKVDVLLLLGDYMKLDITDT
ncbi:hypothetical protein [Paenibacillus lautus]|uniref:hypothetical protein n=1 Tax=Paenibacillus lautus TaxID=1401 RepID=UPI001C7DD783|nr:hypothetical protein [Paenibacillus lautus]